MSRDNEKKEKMGATYAVWTALCVGCMAVMLWFAAQKTIVIEDVSREQAGVSVNPAQSGMAAQGMGLRFEESGEEEKSFQIPLPRGLRAENVTMENRYMEKELWISLQSTEEEFYGENSVSGDLSPVLSGWCEEQEDGILLKFRMNRVLEYRSTMDGSTLTIAWFEPKELYDYVVILEPAQGESEAGTAGGGVGERDVTLQVARQVQKKFASQGARLYLTQAESTAMSGKERLGFAREVSADLYIRLSVYDEKEPELYGISGIYNEEYFIPEFGNLDLADLVTREVTIAASNRATGLETAGEDSFLKGLWMPSAEVSLGYLSNPQESYLLGQETYQEKLADGIVNAITEAVRILKEQKSGGGTDE